MNAEFQKKISDALQNIQEELPTNELIYHGVHIWPIIKFDFFLKVLIKYNQYTKSDNPITTNTRIHFNIVRKIINKIKVSCQYFYLTRFYSKTNQILSVGDWDHRVNDNGLWINRYYANVKKNRIHFELTSIKKDNIELKSNTFVSEDLYYFHKHYFTKATKRIKLDNDELVKKIVDSFNQKTGLNFGYSDFNEKLNNIFDWADLWEKILHGVRPKEIRILCYYGTAMYGLCIAGNRNFIPVIDMQHGVFGDLNPDYRNFGKLPNNIFSSIPSYFSVWNLQSKLHLEKEKIVNSENILLEGNPWIVYNQQKFSGNIHPKTNILYTLQTTVQIPPFMYSAIRETAINYKWILKTHPRMTDIEIESIRCNLNDLIIDNKVELNSDMHLFELLQTAIIHVSGFSGSVLEAGLLEVPTIINSRTGLEIYRKSIEEQPNLYKYAETKDEFMNALSSFVLDKNSLSCTF